MKKNKRTYCLLAFLISLIVSTLNAQTHDFGFRRNDSVQFTNINGLTIDLPWLGGMNSCQFFEMDLDQNGLNDLVVFDKHGNRILPFLKYNSCGLQKFIFAPEYTESFPPLESWVQSHDFNFDEKMDLFTYTTGGIKVYKNISEGETLKFELYNPRMNSDYGSGMPVNLFTSSEDYPAIADIDGDDDLDVLNFWTLGKFVDYHKNVTIETYGSYDSLNFSLDSRCWGHFSEHESSNVLFLNDDCTSKNEILENTRHTGSTLLAYDFFGNGLKDLLIGDVDYPNLILLRNGGTLDSAHIISQDTLFPNPSKPVKLYSMPVANMIDLNFDDKKDLIVSPFDPSLIKSENQKSVWVYNNTGTIQTPVFEFSTDAFFQNRMIDFGSGAYPIFADIDNNGTKDIIVGNWGTYDSSNYVGSILYSYYSSSITLIKNTGTANNPMFEQISADLGNLRQYGLKGLYPAAADIDHDSDIDLIVGHSDGTLIFLENTAGPGNPMQFGLPVMNYLSIDAGDYSAPQLFDIDKDGKIDLLIGNRAGKIMYYKNNGTVSNPVFELVTSQIGGVDVRDYNLSYFGYACPNFFIKNDTTYLFVGSESGKIYSYKNIDNNLEGNFTLGEEQMFFVRDNHRFPIKQGIRTSVAVGDLNNDGFPELLVGNYAGGLTYYSGMEAPSIFIGVSETTKQQSDITIYPNPTKDAFSVKIESAGSSIKKVEVKDVFGRIVAFWNEPQRNIFDVSMLKNGIYFIEIELQNKTLKVEKLLKR